MPHVNVQVEQKLWLQTDPSDMMNDIIYNVRKVWTVSGLHCSRLAGGCMLTVALHAHSACMCGFNLSRACWLICNLRFCKTERISLQGGRISDVGVYAGYCNHFNIGAFMEKVLLEQDSTGPAHARAAASAVGIFSSSLWGHSRLYLRLFCPLNHSMMSALPTNL